MSIPEKENKYTFADYLMWDEGERVELIDGKVINMSPAPSRKHQQILREFSTEFSLFLRGKDCEVFFAPFDVRLFSASKRDDEITDVVQPDLSIVCNPEILDDKGCNGAPDMIIEILSPSSVKLDRWDKYMLYEKAGVKEYWIADPINESVEVYLKEGEQFKLYGVYTKNEIVSVSTLVDFEIDLNQIFI